MVDMVEMMHLLTNENLLYIQKFCSSAFSSFLPVTARSAHFVSMRAWREVFRYIFKINKVFILEAVDVENL